MACPAARSRMGCSCAAPVCPVWKWGLASSNIGRSGRGRALPSGRRCFSMTPVGAGDGRGRETGGTGCTACLAGGGPQAQPWHWAGPSSSLAARLGLNDGPPPLGRSTPCIARPTPWQCLCRTPGRPCRTLRLSAVLGSIMRRRSCSRSARITCNTAAVRRVWGTADVAAECVRGEGGWVAGGSGRDHPAGRLYSVMMCHNLYCAV